MARTPRSNESFSQAGELRRELIDDRLLDELLASASERGIAGEEFVAKKIGHDTARTRYNIDRTPRQAPERQAAGQAFEPPQHHQATPSADSLSM